MKCLAALALVLAAPVAQASAAHVSFAISGDVGGGGFHIGFGGRSGFAGGLLGGGFFGGGLLNSDFTEVLQTRFEDRFADIMSTYDDGVAAIDDYYASDDYADILDDQQRLVDRYDWFVTGVERSIDHLGDFITHANDELTFLQDLLNDYQARDDLSETRLARIEDWITGASDHVQLKIDLLTEKQSNLTEALPTFQDFQTQITTYLDDITAAGGGSMSTGDGSSGDSASALRVLAVSGGSMECQTAALVAAGAIPEPRSGALGALAAIILFGIWRRRCVGLSFKPSATAASTCLL